MVIAIIFSSPPQPSVGGHLTNAEISLRERFQKMCNILNKDPVVLGVYLVYKTSSASVPHIRYSFISLFMAVKTDFLITSGWFINFVSLFDSLAQNLT